MRTSIGFFDTGTSGKMRIHTRPDALHEARERAARGFDLARGDAFRLERLQAVLAEGERRRRWSRCRGCGP